MTDSWLPLPLQLLFLCPVGWVNHRQTLAIEYLRTENGLLRGRLAGRLKFTDAERQRLAR